MESVQVNGASHRKRENSFVRSLSNNGGGMEGVVVEASAAGGHHVPRSMKHTLYLGQLLMLNAVVCGLEFCASAAFTYIPPMLLKAGLDEEHMSFVLGIGPLFGLILVPIIGTSSDKCRSRYGRRRPYILGLSVLLILSLMIIPYGEMLGVYMLGRGNFSNVLGLWALIIGSVLLDFTTQAALTPCEALLSDACTNTDSQDRAFTVYSFMVSVGGCIGYLITALDWANTSIGVFLGGQEKCAFTILIVFFTFTLLTTLGVAQEAPLVPVQEISPLVNKRLDQIHQALVKQKEAEIGMLIPAQDPGYESGSNQSSEDFLSAANRMQELDQMTSGTTWTPARQREPGWLRRYFLERNCNIPFTKVSFTRFDALVQLILFRLYSLLPQSIRSLFNVPLVLRRLATANFFCWTAIMGFNLFFTDFVGQAIYKGNPNAEDGDPAAALYDQGVRWGSWGLLFHCVTSAIYAPFVEKLVRRYGVGRTYMAGMISFTIAMVIMVFTRSPYIVNLVAGMTGIGYATVTTIPFMLLIHYHDHKEVSL